MPREDKALLLWGSRGAALYLSAPPPAPLLHFAAKYLGYKCLCPPGSIWAIITRALCRYLEMFYLARRLRLRDLTPAQLANTPSLVHISHSPLGATTNSKTPPTPSLEPLFASVFSSLSFDSTIAFYLFTFSRE